MVEGTPLLREHLVKNWIQGSNPCVSANTVTTRLSARFYFLDLLSLDTPFTPIATPALWQICGNGSSFVAASGFEQKVISCFCHVGT